MIDVAIVGAVRTPIGKFGGCFANCPTVDLGAIVVKEAIKRSKLNPENIDRVYMGNVIQAGQGQNPARQVLLNAGIPYTSPAFTINCVCGSGLEVVNLAARDIMLGESEIVVAGGMENMSMSPYVLDKARFGYRMNDGKIKDTMIYDALWDKQYDYHMGVTAENIAAKYDISREEQDAFAAKSQQKCQEAQKNNIFGQEIVPVVLQGKNGVVVIDTDEAPRKGVTKESISKLKSVFIPDGTVTAANSSGINDGAAAVILMPVEKAKILGIDYVTYITGAEVGTDPRIMGIGAALAAKKALEKARMTISEIDLIEANEAFASQSLACARIGGWDKEEIAKRVNINGGAIALGHPVGASGCRILVSLIHSLKRCGGKYGLACLCVGGGMGISVIIRN
jgi:acetyl-CoA C-acetyltransferase